jgi:hypothetical protein
MSRVVYFAIVVGAIEALLAVQIALMGIHLRIGQLCITNLPWIYLTLRKGSGLSGIAAGD